MLIVNSVTVIYLLQSKLRCVTFPHFREKIFCDVTDRVMSHDTNKCSHMISYPGVNHARSIELWC